MTPASELRRIADLIESGRVRVSKCDLSAWHDDDRLHRSGWVTPNNRRLVVQWETLDTASYQEPK